MKPYLQDADVTLYCGGALETLRKLEAGSVDCCVTSPPFWALRDYGTGTWEGGDPSHKHDMTGARGGRGGSGAAGKQTADAFPSVFAASVCSCGARHVDHQIGVEATVGEWAANLVGVFEEVRRVLVPSGVCLIEIGDSYVSGQGGRQSAAGELPKTARSDRTEPCERDDVDVSSWSSRQVATRVYPARETRLKPKDLVGQPFELAFALRTAGWWWRGMYPWHKVNAMPESVTDRCTTAHSYVIHLAKQPRYFWNQAAIAEPAAWERWGDQTTPKYEGTDTASGWIKPRARHELVALGGRTTNGQRPRNEERRGFDNRLERADGFKNARSVWEIPTEGNGLAICTVCGAYWEGGSPREHCGQRVIEHYAAFAKKLARRCTLAGCPEGGIVLDPFAGSGTTGLVARKHGRHAVLIELSKAYCQLAARRLAQQSLLAEPA